MIVYFADRKFNILGLASTALPGGFSIVSDMKTEDVESGVASFECTLSFSKEQRIAVEACAEVGNYILRKNGTENEFYTIIDAEIDTKKQDVYVYAEDAGLDLLNEVAGEYEADQAYNIAHYINKFANDSGFVIGINEVSSLTRKLSWDGEATVTERIASVATQFGGCEISYSFDIDGMVVTNKYINIYQKRGKDIGVQLRLNRDIDRIITKKSIANLATSLRCTGGTPTGSQGVVSHVDSSGVEYYTWIKFSESASGEMADTIGSKRYIGLAWDNRASTESNKNADYTWTQFFTNNTVIVTAKSSGILESEKTSTGKSRYTWIKFATSEKGAGMDDSPSGKTYIGIARHKSKSAKSTKAEDYTWTRMFGDEAKARYIVGTGAGAVQASDGTYTWVKYADDSAGNGISNSPAGKKYCGISVGRTSSTESTKASDYTWREIVDNDYTNGEYVTCKPAMFGIKENGKNTYTWVKFAESETGSGIADTTVNKKYIGIAYNKSTNNESNKAADYTWDLLRGDDAKPITLKGYKYDDGDFYVSGTRLNSRSALKKWSRYRWEAEPNQLSGYTGHIIKQFSYDTTSQKELCSHAVTELKKLCDLEVNYEVDIAKLPDNVRIGDTVNIVDDAGELYLSTRILKLETSIVDQTYTATLGEFLLKESGISQKVADLADDFARIAAENQKAREEAAQAQKEAQEAQNKADQAAADLESARQNALDAQTSADEAQEAADEAAAAAAQAKADAADAAAQVTIAQSNAETAIIKADAAQSTADTAKTEAADAKSTADAAKLDAQTARDEIAALGENLETVTTTMEAEYSRKTDLTETESRLQSQISQNAAQIESTVSSVTRIDETVNDAKEQAAQAQNTANAAQQQAAQASTDAAAAQTAADNAAAAAAAAQTEADNAATAATNAQNAAATAQAKAAAAQTDLDAAKQNLESVSSKADATEQEVNAAKQAVTEAQAAADQARADAQAAQAAADQAAADATTAQNTANTAKTAADNAQAAADEAKQAADDAKAAADALAVRVTTAETNITQNSEQISLRATKEEVATAVNNIALGGRNYLLDTKEERSNTYTVGNVFIDYDFSADLLESSSNSFMISYDAKYESDDSKMKCAFYFRGNGGSITSYTAKHVEKEYKRYTQAVQFKSGYSIADLVYCRFVITHDTSGGTGGTVYLKNVKLEAGNKATDWTPAPEDVDDAIETVNETVHTQKTEIVAESESIVISALESYVQTGDYEEFKSTVESQFQILSDEISMQFTSTNTRVDEVDGELQERTNEISKHISFSENGIILNSGGNNIELQLDNEIGFVFAQNGNAFGHWDGENFYTGNIVIRTNERAQFGNFAFVPRANGDMTFLDVGGMFALLKILRHPSGVTCTTADSATFTVTAMGSGDLLYQWQYKSADDDGYTNFAEGENDGFSVSGATANSITISAFTAEVSSMQIRCAVTDSAGDTAESNAATLNVTL